MKCRASACTINGCSICLFHTRISENVSEQSIYSYSIPSISVKIPRKQYIYTKKSFILYQTLTDLWWNTLSESSASVSEWRNARTRTFSWIMDRSIQRKEARFPIINLWYEFLSSMTHDSHPPSDGREKGKEGNLTKKMASRIPAAAPSWLAMR